MDTSESGERVRLGVIGAGLIGSKHVELVASDPAAALVGVCDTDPARRPVADALGVPFYGTVGQLLDRARPEGVIVAVPNAEHAAVAVACAERGVSVLVEKPIADTMEHAREIAEAIRVHKVRALVGHHRRHSPYVRKAREVVREGGLGRLVGVSVLWALLKPDEYFQAAWRREKPGGGPLLINLIHDLDSLRFICGEVDSVYAAMSSEARGFAVEDSLAISLRFANGALGAILASDAATAAWSYEANAGENPSLGHAGENCYHFLGASGSLAFPRMEVWRYADGGRGGWQYPLKREVLDVRKADPLRAQLEHFCRVVRGAESPVSSVEDASRSLDLVLAVHESGRLGKAVATAARGGRAGDVGAGDVGSPR